MIWEMKPKPWRERVRIEDELLQQLRHDMSQSAQRRAAALQDGVAELGTVADVARELGRSHTSISDAIKKHGGAATPPATTP